MSVNVENIKVFGPGVDETVKFDQETHFTIDTSGAGEGALDISLVSDQSETKPFWKEKQEEKLASICALNVKVLRAKELIKGDIIGKSDPYAVVKHGSQVYQTKVLQNTHEPEWNFETEVIVPDMIDNILSIEVFDKDKLSKDVSLGKIVFDVSSIIKKKNKKKQAAKWYPLIGVPKGQIQVSTGTRSVDSNKFPMEKLREILSHSLAETAKATIVEKEKGIYLCTYSASLTKKLILNISLGGQAVPGSPFNINLEQPTNNHVEKVNGTTTTTKTTTFEQSHRVSKMSLTSSNTVMQSKKVSVMTLNSSPSPALEPSQQVSKLRIYGPGVEPGLVAGSPTWFTIDWSQAGPGSLAVNITDVSGQYLEASLKESKNSKNIVQYTPSSMGIHKVDLAFNNIALPQSPIKAYVRAA